MNKKIKLEFQYFEGCPNHPKMEINIHKAIEGLEDYVALKHIVVENEDIAREIGFRGSPTLLIDGKDFENVPIPTIPRMACRFYIKGVPSTDEIRERILNLLDISETDLIAINTMEKTKTFAIIGASAKEESYGFKLVKNLTDVGYIVFPINPKYPLIYGLKSYQSLNETSERVDNIVLAMSPANNLKVLEQINENCESYVWFPPECWNEELINKAKEKKLNFLLDVCPIGTYLKLNSLKN